MFGFYLSLSQKSAFCFVENYFVFHIDISFLLLYNIVVIGHKCSLSFVQHNKKERNNMKRKQLRKLLS